LVHTHGYKTDLLVGITAGLAGLPRIATVHLHTRATCALRVYRYLDLMVLRTFPRVIAVSEAIRRELLTAGLSPDRVVTIHNGIDVHQVEATVIEDRTTWLCRWQLDPHAPVVTTIGRLTLQKGQDVLLQAARQLLNEWPTIQFAILGDGPMRETLEQQACQLGIRAQVHFLGYQAEVATWIAASDTVVLPSRDEGLPYVLLEALALARPIVATHVGGIPEVIEDGQHGILVPPEAPRSLAQAILQLLQHPAQAQTLGQAGRCHVQANFPVTAMVEKTVQVYRNVLRTIHL